MAKPTKNKKGNLTKNNHGKNKNLERKNQCQMRSDRRIYSRKMEYKYFIDKGIRSR
jgi:hypothetical protein